VHFLKTRFARDSASSMILFFLGLFSICCFGQTPNIPVPKVLQQFTADFTGVVLSTLPLPIVGNCAIDYTNKGFYSKS
jgi:hypothetical protein